MWPKKKRSPLRDSTAVVFTIWSVTSLLHRGCKRQHHFWHRRHQTTSIEPLVLTQELRSPELIRWEGTTAGTLTFGAGTQQPSNGSCFGDFRARIKNKLRSIYDRLGLENRLELAVWYKGQQRQETEDIERNKGGGGSKVASYPIGLANWIRK